MTNNADGLVWRPLEDLPPLRHGVARRADDDRPVVLEFTRTVQETFAR